MHRMLRITFAVGIGLFAQASGNAQQHPAVERGFARDKLFHFADGNLDSVDTFSGNLSLSIPLSQNYSTGGGLSYSMSLTYSSSVYDFDEINNGGGSSAALRSRPARHFNAGVGWVLSFGELVNPSDPGNETGRLQYRDGAGGLHGTYPTLHAVDDPVPGFSYTKDSTYLRLHELASGKRQLEIGNGEIHTFSSSGRIESIKDRNDNMLTITYPDALTWRLEDDHGRVHFVRFTTMTSDGASVNVVDKVEIDAFGDTTATYDFTYQNSTVHRACTDTFFMPGSSLSVPLLTKLILPDSSTYSMTYTSAQCDDGLLASITLPAKGKIQYAYVP